MFSLSDFPAVSAQGSSREEASFFPELSSVPACRSPPRVSPRGPAMDLCRTAVLLLRRNKLLLI